MVTGGAGFIGSHTVDALLDHGLKVWVLDDLSSGSLGNLKGWKDNRKLHFKKGSVVRYKSVESLARKVDAIIHLAAVVSPNVSVRRPEVANEVNVSGTLNVLRAALRTGVERVVFASSSSVYGNSKSARISEDAALEPITPYGVSKLAAEKYCRVYHETYDLSTVCLRYFNVYGERQSSNPYSGVIAIFARRLLKGLRPIIYGDGNQTRDFIQVSDVVNANLSALRAARGVGEAFNIGTGRATAIKKLHRVIADLAERNDISPIFAPARLGDVRLICARTEKARTILGFEPRVSLRFGLKSLIESLRAKKH